MFPALNPLLAALRAPGPRSPVCTQRWNLSSFDLGSLAGTHTRVHFLTRPVNSLWMSSRFMRPRVAIANRGSGQGAAQASPTAVNCEYSDLELCDRTPQHCSAVQIHPPWQFAFFEAELLAALLRLSTAL